VVARLPDPKFSYAAGPQGCTQPDGYPDAALCTVPNEAPPGSFRPPAAGGSYVDPNFGSTVKVLTGTGVYHTYSANSPLSAKNTYLMTYPSSGNFDVLLTSTGKVAFSNVPANQDFFWDSYTDSVYYYTSGAAFIKHDLKTERDTTVVDYARDGHGFRAIKRGGTTGGSKDNWISFFAEAEKQVCVLDLNTVKTYCAGYGNVSGVPYGDIDYALDAKGVDKGSGKRYVILVSKGATPGFFSVNLSTERLDPEFRGPEDPESKGNHNGVCDAGEKCMYPSHADTFEDSAGIQYLIYDNSTESPCEVATATYQISRGLNMMQPVELGGGRRKIMSLWKCPYPQGTDEHIGCAKNAPRCVISTVAPLRSATDPPVRYPHATEIILVKDNGAEVRRLAQSRSVRFSDEGGESYWAMPRAALSNDGSLVIADSNFGVKAGVRVVLIRTDTGRPVLASSGVLNTASRGPKIAPGAFAILQGESLANCTASVTPPETLPDNLCGARVTFNSIPAKLTAASPDRIDVLTPRSLTPQTDVEVAVSVEGAEAGATAAVAAADFNEVAPAMFTYTSADGVERAVAQNSDGVLNGPGPDGSSAAAQLGTTLVLYANALGPTDRIVADGDPTPADPPAQTVRTVEVYVNDVRQTLAFSGMSPGSSGVYQVNFVLNPDTPVNPDGQNLIWLNVNGMESPRVAISLAPAPAPPVSSAAGTAPSSDSSPEIQ
jgi:uncharacterized protein (TIGR03437 family)